MSKPVCLVFRNLVTMQEDNSGFSVLLEMLAELYQKQPKIGYHLLYYLKARLARPLTWLLWGRHVVRRPSLCLRRLTCVCACLCSVKRRMGR